MLPRSSTCRPCFSSVDWMLATRRASGPMLAPRAPAPTSVGAPIRLTIVFMGRDCPSSGGLHVLGESPRLRGGCVEAVLGLQQFPGLFRGLDVAEELDISGGDHAGVDQH